MSKEPTFMIINKATDGDYCLAIRGRKVVLALSIPHDPFQQWIRKDAAKKDSEGQPASILVNKATNEALSYDETIGPMNLVRYSAGLMDKSVLWTESKNDDQGFRYIRRESIIYWHMTPRSHILHDGSIVELTDGDHISDWWKFVPNSKNQQETTQHTVTISCRKKVLNIDTKLE